MKKTIALLILISSITSFNAIATNFVGSVTQIAVGGGGLVYIAIEGYPASGCSVNKRFAIDTNSKSGQAMYAMALTSNIAGKKMGVIGNDSCNWPSFGDAEGVINTYTIP